MNYVKQNWSNDPIDDTPLSSDRLNHMENGIENVNNIGSLTQLKTDAKANLVEVINELEDNIIYYNSRIDNFTNGVFYIPLAPLGISIKPDVVLLTPQSQPTSLQYDFDNSDNNSIKIVMTGSTFTGPNRYCIMIMKGGKYVV